MDISGQKIGRWTILEQLPERSRSGHSRFLCRCDCGTEKTVLGYKIRLGSSTSCGCISRELSKIRATTHGLTKHRLFPIWNSMMDRCYKPLNSAYARYGGRGIVVCDRWHDVASFIADNELLFRPGLTIDRINNDGHYSLENVRWSTRAEQNRNRSSNVFLTFEGKTQILFAWAREKGIAPRTLWARIHVSGWSIERALTT